VTKVESVAARGRLSDTEGKGFGRAQTRGNSQLCQEYWAQSLAGG